MILKIFQLFSVKAIKINFPETVHFIKFLNVYDN